MVKCETKINGEAQNELCKGLKIASIILLILGIEGLLLYICAGVFEIEVGYDFLLLFAIPFAFGLIFLLTVKKLVKEADKMNAVNCYEFYEDYFVTTSFRNGEVIGTSKLYYKDLLKVKFKKNYICIFINGRSIYPVKKDNLSAEEYEELFNLLKK